MKSHFLKQGILVSTLMIISALTIFTFSSCNKEEVDNNETVINDNYYVKYVISCSYPKIFSNWSVTTPQGEYTKNGYQIRHWEQTYGPVKKGFKCEVQVGNGEPTIEIYVSKNQEPFALKTTKTGKSASYTIDF
ncbi:hypothetical protein [Petrimonas mucosa]|jgi:hypothetical protein|uniref:Lipoprotein n=1 Tax=Petrimonas mucosa TaxID=1642646 RepID=A0A1G4G6Z1_9BACT|nr:hypothetical protein [Petrimonas mucosa]SCM57639.1 putative protein {ECO:0000313/EMBL:EAZ94686,1} [Petrimonas mucosa]